MDKKNTIKVYTTSSGAELNISAPSTKQVISATNNRAQYFAEQAKKYRDEAKLHRDNAKYYAEQNSDVTFEYIDNIRASLEDKIATKQNRGNYVLKNELPENVSELINDAEYVNKTELDDAIAEVELPSQEGCAGRFLMSDGENESWVGINSFQLFDTKLSDHVLTYEESKGWALQGTYVYKEAVAGSRYGYPDFYAKCLEEYNEATGTETVNGVSVKVHSNGHKFYNVADKTAIDESFSSLGTAWFYGIDTENERIFLPRNNYFEQVTGTTSEVGNSVKAGLPNIKGYINGVLNSGSGAFVYKDSPNSKTPNASWEHPSSNGYSFDASRSSSIYGNSGTVQPNAIKKLLYICVGNTTSESVITDVVDVTTTENDTVPLFTGQYFDFKPNNPSWLKAGEQVNSGSIYATAYNELVNELTNPKYGLKVIETSAMQSDVDYSEYWKVNQYEMWFKAPTRIGMVADLSNAKSETAQLYFKVANAVENFELLNVGEVMEAVNSIVPNNSSLIASYGLPSDKYINLELGASGSTYTAPADGCVCLEKYSSASGQYGILFNSTSSLRMGMNMTSATQAFMYIPVKKDDVYGVYYSLAGKTSAFRFIYAEGSKGEA